MNSGSTRRTFVYTSPVIGTGLVLSACSGENKTQSGKQAVDLALRLALDRRPKRAQSSQPFLNDGLPAVIRAIESKESRQFDQAMERLHNACVECHRAEKALYFKSTVERLRDSVR